MDNLVGGSSPPTPSEHPLKRESAPAKRETVGGSVQKDRILLALALGEERSRLRKEEPQPREPRAAPEGKLGDSAQARSSPRRKNASR